MRNIFFVTILPLLTAGCINSEQPFTNSPPASPHDSGITTPNSEQQGTAFTISTEAYYQARLQSPNSPGKIISLSLTPARKAKMTTDFLDAKPMVVDTGGWATLKNGNLKLRLQRIGSPDTLSLEFSTDGDKLILMGNEYGTAGLTLWVKPIPQDQ